MAAGSSAIDTPMPSSGSNPAPTPTPTPTPVSPVMKAEVADAASPSMQSQGTTPLVSDATPPQAIEQLPAQQSQQPQQPQSRGNPNLLQPTERTPEPKFLSLDNPVVFTAALLGTLVVLSVLSR